MIRSEPLRPITYSPRGYCREGHPVMEHTMLGSVGDLTAVSLPHDQSEVLERQALEIFTLMANSGRSFAVCLSAVLLTGIRWGSSLERDSDSEPRGEA